MATSRSNLLAVVLDMNPVWWGQMSMKNPEISFSRCVDSLIAACNAFAMMGSQNKLCFIVSYGSQDLFVYPPPAAKENISPERGSRDDNGCLPFDKLGEIVREEICEIVRNSGDIQPDCVLTGAISKALCFFDRMHKEAADAKPTSRILVVKGSQDNPLQYIEFTSIISTAQKMDVTIDSCILDNDSTFLRQASELTRGVYLKLSQLQGFLEYVMYLYLPDSNARSTLALPSPVPMGHKAACFCHKALVDVGFVCSVCLSIFCDFSPFCQTCLSTYKINLPPRVAKKKQKTT